MTTPNDTPKEPSFTQQINKLASDVNLFNQLAYFCGIISMKPEGFLVRLQLADRQGTTLHINSSMLLVPLSEIAQQLQIDLNLQGIDTEELLEDVGNSIRAVTRQTGG